MPTRFLLLRHAESADPTVFHGAESNIGLSARGRRQAVAVAGVLADLKPQHIVSSAMTRAINTATPIAAACGLELRIEPDLHERRVGALSGKPHNVKEGIWPDTLARWMAGDTHFAPPGSESFDNVRDRVLPIWQRLAAEYQDRCVVIVAHGLVCKVLLLTLLPEYNVADWLRLGSITNVGISELVEEAGIWRATRLVDMPDAVRAVHVE